MLHKMIFPVRRVWLAVSARLRARKNGAGLLELHNDVQTCGYEDVQVMWEILRRSESELMASLPKRKQRPFGEFLFGLTTVQPHHSLQIILDKGLLLDQE